MPTTVTIAEASNGDTQTWLLRDLAFDRFERLGNAGEFGDWLAQDDPALFEAVAALEEAGEEPRWNGHTPSPFDWQALIVFRSGTTRIYQFNARTHDRKRALDAAAHWAMWDRAVAFLLRDTKGTVVACLPVTDALGNPLDPRWEDAVAKAGCGSKRVA